MTNSSEDPSSDHRPTRAPVVPDALHPSMRKIVHFTDIALCGDEVWIEHRGQLYRLQSTRSGKLVLTKYPAIGMHYRISPAQDVVQEMAHVVRCGWDSDNQFMNPNVSGINR